MSAIDPGDVGVTALLGPTNTGKTHRAIERMLEHESGIIGLPLRLLAREVYDRITARIGEGAVALVTGEEKRIPRHPRYWVCTVEAMPVDQEADFLAVDEIQLCTNRERGHVFTDRLLHARGRRETWFLGSEVVHSLVERLLPTARIRNHPRLSQLRGQPPMGLSGLPKRSAVVAFSAQRVYEIAERVRHRHGGAALVLGALSPRTRNAQVAMYQSGEVDYLVATDAIGMGLNLNIRHVAFADFVKFDGREARPLELAELAQIAGRAGRYLDDGTFGVLAPLAALAPSSIRALERHRFPPEQQLFWRNSQLDFSSPDALVASLREPPPRRELRALEPAADHRALMALCRSQKVRSIVTSHEWLALLWEVCQIPDYPQLLFELHIKLLEEIFVQLTGRRGLLDSAWIEVQLRRIDRPEGDIEALMGRISEIRTWTYVSQHAQWLEQPRELGERTRDIEDRLSDALHHALVSRFVERRKAFALPRAAIAVNQRPGQKPNPFAQLLASQLSPQAQLVDPVTEQARFTERLAVASHEQFRLDSAGRLHFEDKRVGALIAGSDLLHPDVQVRLEPDPGRGACTRVQRRLLAFCRDLVQELLSPLRHGPLTGLSGPSRGLLYQLEQGLGTVRVADCQHQLSYLGEHERQALMTQGLRFGVSFLYVRRLLEPDAVALRTALVAPHHRLEPVLAESIQTQAFHAGPAPLPFTIGTALGFAVVGPMLLRVDQFERLTAELRNCGRAGPFQAPRDLAARFGCERLDVMRLLSAIGYRQLPDGRWFGGSGRQDLATSSRRRRRRTGKAHSPTESNSGA